ncbi:FKBP-type peptidyl-prolyl cis-trans isomerase [Chitinophaga vietnamensis]|uniref:FKBP-type peptidyl-prolyl cis-trans isomerase n=1 Tax=Chitinophaga vietnamensis TaxID=2593957 RepID=UPI00137641D9|nr:FKBP-type peptidyl-prolyl cis-trans isomerase [Chitinophaga vietnamensis]
MITLFLITGLSACMKEQSSLNDIMQAGERSDNAILSYLRVHNDTTVSKDPSGLFYKIIYPGDSIHYLSLNSIPTVSYTYQLTNDQVVVNSFGETDFNGRRLKDHILGWQIGLKKISKGGKIILYMPPSLAFGTVGIPGLIPPEAVVISEVELIDFR